MTSQALKILRIKRADAGSGNILLHITPARAGSLELKLVATEQEHLYHCTIRESNLKSLQAERYEGSLQDFKHVLRAILLQEASDESIEASRDIELTSAIDEDTLTIHLRRNVAGIKSAIGSIVCIQDDEREAVSFPEWVDTALAASETAHATCQELKRSLSSAKDQVSKLTAQLDELLLAKKAHEDDMLKKFATLLNAKKLKIRDQQRLLGDMARDPKLDHVANRGVAEEQHMDSTNGGRGSARKSDNKASRTSKRKASDHDADEIMVNANHETDTEGDEISDQRQVSTPPPDQDENSDDEAFEAAYPLSQSVGHVPTSTEGQKNDGLAKERASGAFEAIPERRELPFGKKKAKDQAPAKMAQNDSTDDDDDEI
nr:hypothetical protein CFP56_44276 [Quercus suber]